MNSNNIITNLEMFCVYHKKFYLREDNFYFTFFGVNEVYPKDDLSNNILEYELDNYNPFLQKRGYMETSAYLHVYWNKLYENKDMVGFSQYDMKHAQKYDNIDNKTIYLLNANKPIVKDGKWEAMMFPKIRNLDFLMKSYNAHFNKNYTVKELENKPLSLWQTNIYPVAIYEKLCGWLEKLVDEIYPWSNEPPYETHFGSIGGYTERALSIFNAFEIYEGTPYSNLNIQHGIGTEVNEQYNYKSFLNNYSQDVHCKIVEESDVTKDYCIVGIEKQNNTIIKATVNGITQLFYIDEHGNKSKTLMMIGNSSNDTTFKWKHNILDCFLDDYDILYKKISDNIYNISITKIYYSRGLLDKMIYMNFINQKNEDGVMIEIGGHTGDRGGSNTYYFEKYLGYKTFLIEPSEQSFKELVMNRPKSENINKAVSYKKEMIKLFGNNEVASTIGNGSNYSLVKGEPIKDILEKYKLKYVDMFVIDTEGSELTVLETFDWNIEVGIILIEILSEHPSGMHSNHLSKDKKVIEFLIDKGFTYQFSDDEMTNQIWVNKEYSRKHKQFIGKPSMDNDLLKKNHYLQRNYRFTISKNISHSRMQTHEIITHFINKDTDGNPRGARVACNEFFPMISNEMNIIKPLSNDDNIPLSFQKKIRNEKITCFSYSNNNKVYDISFPTIEAYCEQHNYRFIPYHTNLEHKYKPHWNKLHYSIKLLKESNSEYIVWFDHDIIIKNYNIKLEDIITKYKFNQSNALFMMSQDPASHHPFNTGVIVFKNYKDTLNIFQEFLEMRNNPHKYPILNNYGGFNFNGGMQDTRVMLAYFHQNKDRLLSIPHKILQSFYGQAEFYSTGDFCGHVAGPQGELLISKLNDLKNIESTGLKTSI